MLLFGLLLTLLLARFGSAWCLPLALLGMAWSVGMPWYLFKEKGYLLDPVFPALTTLLIYIASSLVSYLKSESERRQIKNAFSRYMSPALVEQLARHPEKLILGGELREMTWHFCDIRGYDDLRAVRSHGRRLSIVFDPIVIILSHQGVVDKYMGDCIMASGTRRRCA